MLGMMPSMHCWRETAHWWCDISGAVYSIVCPYNGEVVFFLSPSLMFLASFRGPLVIRVFCAQEWDTATRCHSPRVHINGPQVWLSSHTCRNVGCKLVFFWLHRSWTHATAPGWLPLPVPSWGEAIFYVLGQFLLHNERDKCVSFGEAVNSHSQSSHITCVSRQLCLSKMSYVFVLKSKEGSIIIFQINIQLA